MGCFLLFKLFGSDVSGCGLSEYFPSWFLECGSGGAVLCGEAAVCLDTDSWSVRNAVLSLLCGAPPMWMEVSRV